MTKKTVEPEQKIIQAYLTSKNPYQDGTLDKAEILYERKKEYLLARFGWNLLRNFAVQYATHANLQLQPNGEEVDDWCVQLGVEGIPSGYGCSGILEAVCHIWPGLFSANAKKDEAVVSVLSYNPGIALEKTPLEYRVSYYRIFAEDGHELDKLQANQFTSRDKNGKKVIVYPAYKNKAERPLQFLDAADLLYVVRRIAEKSGLNFHVENVDNMNKVVSPHFILTQSLPPTLEGWQEGAQVIGTIDALCRLYLG